MRILWVKVGGLWPANSGGRLRSFHILSELSQQHEVSVVTTLQPGEIPGELARHLPRCEQVLSVPYNAPKHGTPRFITALAQSWFTSLPVDLYKNRVPEMRRAVTRLLKQGNFDICVADFLTGLPNVPHDLPVPIVLFTHNVEHMIWQRLCMNETNPLKRLLLNIEWRKMRAYEKRACQLADVALTVSETDKELFQKLAPTSNLHAIPTGVDVNYFSPAHPDLKQQEQELEIVFSGSMDWFPNEDAMLWFMDSMLPLIRKEQPGVTVTIVGRNPSEKLRRLAATCNVHVTGTVDDVRPSVHRASVYIVPLRVGGGTRLKLFEAAAMGKAIVSTTVGAEGLPMEHGKHIVLADTPEAFAREVLNLVKDPALRARLGRAGRELVQTRYSWARVAADFEALCHEVRRDAGTAPNNPYVITGGSEI